MYIMIAIEAPDLGPLKLARSTYCTGMQQLLGARGPKKWPVVCMKTGYYYNSVRLKGSRRVTRRDAIRDP